jgi:osmotically-inducible protein OsmY
MCLLFTASLMLWMNQQDIAAQNRPAAADAQIAAEVQSILRRYDRYTVFDDVNVHVQNGSVLLEGKVTDAGKRADIEEQVRRLDEVTDVRNRIQPLPASRFDDQIRREVFNIIYGSRHFLDYGMLEKPAIRILVENGHVTLTGSVRNDDDRRLAHVLALQVGALSVANRLGVTRARGTLPPRH